VSDVWNLVNPVGRFANHVRSQIEGVGTTADQSGCLVTLYGHTG
jgi:hypothetical protein